MSGSSDLYAALRAHLDDHGCSWSIGGYGAIAEFHWLPDDTSPTCSDASRHPSSHPSSDGGECLSVATGAGALELRLPDDVVAYAYQGLSRHPERWLQGVSLCLPWRRARRAVRNRVTELGPDRGAIRVADRDALLFDMGLGLPHVDACVRSSDPRLLECLRAACGRSLLAHGNPLMSILKQASPHRVFVSEIGRVEVYQPIVQPGARPATPLGPHTHVLPRLLAARRANADDHDAPPYHRACAYLYPRHPLMNSLGHRKPYDRDAHARFAKLMRQWGDADFVAEKERAREAMRARADAGDYRPPTDRKGRDALRIAIREHAQEGGDARVLSDWRTRFDRMRAPSHPHLAH